MLSEMQRSALSYLEGEYHATAQDVAAWVGCGVGRARQTLRVLQRRGLVVHSVYVDDVWLSTPRAGRVLAGHDRRMRDVA